MSAVSIGLIDDHPILLDGLTHVICAETAYSIVATGHPSQTLALLQSHQPALIILGMSDQELLIATVAKAALQSRTTRVIAYAGVPSVEHAVRTLEAGARGYAAKAGGVEEILQAVKLVNEGEIFISRSFATGVITALRNESLRKAALERINLSVRENQIVQLLLRGRTNKEIASQLAIGEKTVKHYMTSLMQKLSARNRTEAVLAAQQLMGSLSAAQASPRAPAHPHSMGSAG